jgi:hypothetical protein
MTKPRHLGIDRLGEAYEAHLGALAIRPLNPDGPLLDGRLIEDGRPAIVCPQQLLDEADLPCLLTGVLRGEPALEIPRRMVGLIQEQEFLPKHPCRDHGDNYQASIHVICHTPPMASACSGRPVALADHG